MKLMAELNMQEVSTCKEECDAAILDAKEFCDLIQKYETKWSQLESDGDEGLREAFEDLGKCVYV